MKYRIWGHVLPQLGELAFKDIGVAELRKWSADVQRGGGIEHGLCRMGVPESDHASRS
ncbi:hypothetical protein [Streptomyces sp. NPDC005407]|uniref:hypothetical protein n=1 Tax=Streptomyces sp. NPDC005407 TaxID=3155340 RepID=UPI0033AAE3BF